MEKLIDTTALAELTGTRPQTIAKWRVTGGGPRFVKVGRSVRYRLNEVERWLSERERTNTGME